MIGSVAFYFFGVVVLALFWVVVNTNNLLYALVSLASGMVLVSGFFFLLDASFLGVIQIIVYTGAVVVMYAFGMMFFDTQKEVDKKDRNGFVLGALVLILGVILVLVLGSDAISSHVVGFVRSKYATNIPSIHDLSGVLFGDYVVAFEAVAVTLLMSMVAGVSVGIRRSRFPDMTKQDDESARGDKGP